MKLLVFQHIECEHPGSFRQFLKQENIDWFAVNLDQGDTIPPLENYDALWVMGGPMDVWDVEEHPWLIAEKEAIRTWVAELKIRRLPMAIKKSPMAWLPSALNAVGLPI